MTQLSKTSRPPNLTPWQSWIWDRIERSSRTIEQVRVAADIEQTTWFRLLGKLPHDYKRGPHVDVLQALRHGLGVDEAEWRVSPFAAMYPRLFASSQERGKAPLPSGFEVIPPVKRVLDGVSVSSEKNKPIGRDSEVEQLKRFLVAPEMFRWWVVTGHEGAGKTNVVEYIARSELPNDGWTAVKWRPSAGELRNWSPTAPTLIIVDDAGYFAGHINEALEGLARREKTFVFPVRMLLIDTFASPIEPDRGAQPSWYGVIAGTEAGSQHNPLIGAALYSSKSSSGNGQALAANSGGHSLYLGPLAPEDIDRLVDQYAHCAGSDRAILKAKVKTELTSDGGRHDFWLPLQVKVATKYLEGSRIDSQADDGEGWERIVERVTLDRIECRWQYQIEEVEHHSHQTCMKIIAMLWLSTLCGGVELLSWKGSSVEDLLPSEQELTGFHRLCGTLDVELDLETQVLKPVGFRLLGDWFVRVLAESDEKTLCKRPWFKLSRENFTRLARWAQHNNRTAVMAFRERVYPIFRESSFWRMLSGVLGRYATPFGTEFDKPEFQGKLLGGEMREAGEAYQSEVERAAEQACSTSATPILTDLMAGGGARLPVLRKKFPNLNVLAKDRDISRIKVEEVDDPRLVRAQCEIAGRCGIAELLAKHWQRRHCDIIIARKALHEINWHHQQQLIFEIAETLADGGRAVIHLDGADLIAEEARREYDALVRPLTSGTARTPADLGKLFDKSFDDFGESGPAAFINAWIKLKDWKNNNEDETRHRYFSTAREVIAEFRKHGLVLEQRGDQQGHAKKHFHIHAVRFNESGLNELYYSRLLGAPGIEDFRKHIVVGDERHRFLLAFTNKHLGVGPGMEPTALGRMLKARWDDFDFSSLFPKGLTWKKGIAKEEFQVSGGLFECPMHILTFRKAGK